MEKETKVQRITNTGNHLLAGGLFGFIAMILTLHAQDYRTFGVRALIAWFLVTIAFEVFQMWWSWRKKKAFGSFFHVTWNYYLPAKWLDTLVDILAGNALPLIMILAAIFSRIAGKY